jgi:UDP-N-acetylmuramoyl-tripeptide--D-alanyl-D-alanine ligase
MSALWTAEAAARATGGAVAGDWRATGVSIDSRTLAPGELFVALEDVRDGHDFVADALARGAPAAMVARPPAGVEPSRLLVVDDTQTGLEALGAAARAGTRARIVGITGSVGKTGAKSALARGLARQGPTQASAKSHNNHWGVPLSLAQLPADVAFGVFEMGMNHAGEISRLTAQVQPEVALITAIAPAHLENFDDESGIARAKAEIFEGLAPEGVAVIPADSPHTPLLTAAARAAGCARLLRFGAGGEVRARDTAADAAGTSVEALVDGTPLRFRVGLPGAHWVTNSLGLLAVVAALGADVEDFAASLAGLRAEPGRGRRHRLAVAGGDATLLDDAYNANPASMRAALAVLATAPGRKLAALGAMKELGPTGPALHAALADPLAEAGVARVFTVGAEMEALAARLPAERHAGHAERAAELVAAVRAELRPGDTLLVKGSLASGMGALVGALTGSAAAEGA